MTNIIAIDGPAGAGKGTVAKIIAEKLGYTYIDTGAIYRVITLKLLREKISPEEESKIKEVLKSIKINLICNESIFDAYLDDENVSKEIRTSKVDEAVPLFASLQFLREEVLIIERKITENTDIVIEGRDICTKVFPNANVKIFLDASLEVRARRRYEQNVEMGITCTYEEIYENIVERSLLDLNREHSPLVITDDAEYIDSSDISVEEVIEKIMNIVKEKVK